MASRTRKTRVAADESVEEIFTDLAGQPDESPVSDLDDDLESQLTEEARARRKAEEAELQVSDDEEDEGAEGEGEDGAEPSETEEPEPLPAEAAEVLFDPKDVQLVLGRAAHIETLEANAKNAIAQADRDLADAEASIETAMEAGNSKDAVKGQRKLADATAAKFSAQNMLSQLAGEKAKVTNDAQALLARAPKDAAGKPIVDRVVTRQPAPVQKDQGSKLFPQFLKHNSWFNDPKHAAKRGLLVALDAELAAEKKLDKNSPEWFAELGRRFNRQHAGLYKTLDGKQVATGKRAPGAGAPVPSGSAPGGNVTNIDPGGIRLVKQDLVEMRRFGMDPDNMTHRRQWLATKKANAAEERRRA